MLILAPITHVCSADMAGIPGGCPHSDAATTFDDFTVKTVLETLETARDSEDMPHVSAALERFADFLRDAVTAERELDGMTRTHRAFATNHRTPHEPETEQ